MYKQHFGLSRNLFGDGIAKEADVYCGPRQKLLSANLTIALSRRDTVAAIYGAPGTGKTTIASHALREMTTRLALACIGHPPVTGHELLELLLTEFGFSPYKNSRTERLQTWRQFLNEMSATDTRVCVLIENAEDVNVEVLKTLEKLTAVDANGCPGCNVLLTATAPSQALLTAPELAGLRQRIRLQSTLPALSVAETREYLGFKARSAGVEYETLFAPDTGHAVHAVSGGIIRVINNTLDSALSIAATRQEPRLSAALVRRVAVSLFGIPEAPPNESERLTAEAAKPSSPSDQKARVEPPVATETKAPNAQPTVTSNPPDAAGDKEAEIADALQELTAEPDRATPPVAVDQRQPPIEAVVPEPKPETSGIPAAPSPARVAAPQAKSPRAEPGEAKSVRQEALMVEEQVSVASDESVALATSVAAASAKPAAVAKPIASLEPPPPTETLASPMAESNLAKAATPAATPTAVAGAAEVPTNAASSTSLPAASAKEVDAFLTLGAAESIPTISEIVQLAESPPAAQSEASSLDIPELINVADALDFESAAAVQSVAGVGKQPRVANPKAQSQMVEQGERELRELRELNQGLANAKALEDISNSMAETLFGDRELEQLATTLAVQTSGGQTLELRLEPDEGEQHADDPKLRSLAGGAKGS